MELKRKLINNRRPRHTSARRLIKGKKDECRGVDAGQAMTDAKDEAKVQAHDAADATAHAYEKTKEAVPQTIDAVKQTPRTSTTQSLRPKTTLGTRKWSTSLRRRLATLRSA